MSHDGDQTALGIERPKTGMFTFDKRAAEKHSCCLRSRSHTDTHPPGSIYGDLNLGLRRGVSTTDELRKTGLFELTPTERMHTCMNTSRADTQSFSEVDVYTETTGPMFQDHGGSAARCCTFTFTGTSEKIENKDKGRER